MPLIKSASKEALSENISEMVHSGYPQKQAVAASLSNQREVRGRAFGGVAPMLAQASNPMMGGPAMGVAGGVPMPTALPSGANNIAGSPGLAGARGFADGGVAGPIQKTFKGPIVSAVPGRTDKHFTHVPSGAFVIPADIVSAHGEGNSLAGMDKLQKTFKMGPHAHPIKGSGTPLHKLASGGGASDKHVGKPVPVKLAGGEIVVPPENVHETMQRVTKKKLTLAQAHAALDQWVIRERKKLVKTLKKLPPPAKD